MNQDTSNQTTSSETTFHKSTTFMDYLHGDIDKEEADIACLYEYARESKAIWEAARQRDKWKVEGLDWFNDAQRTDWKALNPAVRLEHAALKACEALQLHSHTSFSFLLTCFLVCESFPKTDWIGLTPAGRKAITRFERKKIPPLPMSDVWTLKALGVFDEFNEMAEKARPVIENVPPGKQGKPIQLVCPILTKWPPVSYALFTLDYSKSETQLVKEFREWLRLPDNRKRLGEHKKPTTGTTGKPFDRLKDLAAWRLYRELGNDWNAANVFANQHRKERQPFHDARQGQSNKVERAKAALGNEESYFLKAKKRALDYLAEYIPGEFRVSSPSFLDDLDLAKYTEDCRKSADQPEKISKQIS
jgi:hypothetical protein